MLVLSRQRDETIMIGDNIEITVVDIRGDKVRLGITAPNTIPVHRKEVYEAIQRENREAAKVRMEDLPNLPRNATPARPVGEGGAVQVPMRPGRSVVPVTRPAAGAIPPLTVAPQTPAPPAKPGAGGAEPAANGRGNAPEAPRGPAS